MLHMTKTHCGVELSFKMKWERKYKLIHTLQSFVFRPTMWKASKLDHILMLLICLWEAPFLNLTT
jgi:hypothetical protein